MKKQIQYITILCTLLFLSFNSATAQEYRHAIGLKVGNVIQPSYKLFVSESFAFELVAGYHFGESRDRSVALFGEKHNYFNADGLSWYYGAGLGYGNIADKDRVGVYGIVGLEYVIKSLPLTVGIDTTPAINVGGGLALSVPVTVAVRYVIK